MSVFIGCVRLCIMYECVHEDGLVQSVLRGCVKT